MGRNHDRHCHRPPVIYSIGLYRHRSNCRLTDNDGDLPTLQRRYRLTRAGPYVFRAVIRKHAIPDTIITDREPQFTSRFWDQVCAHWSIAHRLSTSFHLQTNVQTERQNQTMEQYLCPFCNYEQDRWVELLTLAEFAYNNFTHASMRMTPYWAVYHCNPVMQFKAPNAPANLKCEMEVDAVLEGLEETHRIVRENLL